MAKFISALCVVVFCGVAAAAASGNRVMVIKVKSVTISGTTQDVLPKGLSKGDRFSGHDKLINVVSQFGRQAGAVVGTDDSTLILTSATTGNVSGTAKLPGGTISFKGSGHLGTNLPIPVVSGTGAFAGAHGTMTAGPGNSPLNTYRLSLP